MDPIMASPWLLSGFQSLAPMFGTPMWLCRLRMSLGCGRDVTRESGGSSLLLILRVRCCQTPWKASLVPAVNRQAILSPCAGCVRCWTSGNARSTLSNPILRRRLLMDKGVCREVGANIFRECRQSLNNAYLFNNGRSAACSSWGMCAAASLFLASTQTDRFVCCLTVALPKGTCSSCGAGLRPGIPTFTTSFRLRRICRLRKGQGKRELRVFCPDIVLLC